MGCIMTPMPNHLSTYLYYYISLPLNHKQCGWKEERSGVERVAMWGGRSVEMVKMSG